MDTEKNKLKKKFDDLQGTHKKLATSKLEMVGIKRNYQEVTRHITELVERMKIGIKGKLSLSRIPNTSTHFEPGKQGLKSSIPRSEAERKRYRGQVIATTLAEAQNTQLTDKERQEKAIQELMSKRAAREQKRAKQIIEDERQKLAQLASQYVRDFMAMEQPTCNSRQHRQQLSRNHSRKR